MIPQPKYAIGQKVWHASTTSERQFVVCPDCVGRLVWKVSTPAGGSFKVPCSTCRDMWGSTGRVLGVSVVVGVTEQLTIGSIQINTDDKDCPVRYMCEETSVGTGTVYSEDKLCASKAEAEVLAAVLVEQRASHGAQKQKEELHEKRTSAIKKPAKK